jgi:hypothetical protein
MYVYAFNLNIILLTVYILADFEDVGELSVVRVGRGSAELLPKQELMKFKEAVTSVARVGDGGMTFNFTVGW